MMSVCMPTPASSRRLCYPVTTATAFALRAGWEKDILMSVTEKRIRESAKSANGSIAGSKVEAANHLSQLFLASNSCSAATLSGLSKMQGGIPQNNQTGADLWLQSTLKLPSYSPSNPPSEQSIAELLGQQAIAGFTTGHELEFAWDFVDRPEGERFV